MEIRPELLSSICLGCKVASSVTPPPHVIFIRTIRCSHRPESTRVKTLLLPLKYTVLFKAILLTMMKRCKSRQCSSNCAVIYFNFSIQIFQIFSYLIQNLTMSFLQTGGPCVRKVSWVVSSDPVRHQPGTGRLETTDRLTCSLSAFSFPSLQNAHRRYK